MSDGAAVAGDYRTKPWGEAERERKEREAETLPPIDQMRGQKGP
jgi:hypothetical protein